METYNVAIVTHLSIRWAAKSGDDAQEQVHAVLEGGGYLRGDGKYQHLIFSVEDVEVTGVFDSDHNPVIVK